ncbi:MAG: calcium/sodium antiporter [Candidatus Delongbacteria bacterium]|nr:calcium/sodium antiporter [Candidatus Delongbacteria bacterium]MCG2761230.1 calcium/sodium antiporter [Candidatus Delongbacteria bacterium]
MLNLIFLLLGFIPLIYGADLLVDSASSLAKKFNIPNIVIGLTIVAFGTSAPELIVNIFASVDHNSDIVLGNIVGSNIFNILGILGISAIIYPLSVKTNTTWIEIPLCLLSAVILLVIANDQFLDNSNSSMIARIDGIILLAFFVIFIVYNIQMMKTGSFDEVVPVKSYSISKAILLIILGLIGLVIGGKIIVFYATKFAVELGISQRIIALTIVSLGTSLPELATSAVAAKKKNVDIAIGNIVGSNIFNAFYVLGTSAVIYPVLPQAMSNFDLMVNVVASLVLFVFIFTGKDRKIDKLEGYILLSLYIIYVIALVKL